MNLTPPPLSRVFQGHGGTAHETAGFAVPLSPKVRKEMDISGLPMTARTVRKLKEIPENLMKSRDFKFKK